MPTLQTTKWIDWTFPDQAYARNKVGFVWGPAQEMPRQTAESGVANPFDAHDKAVALERLRNNKAKMLGQMGVRDTTERSQRYSNNASQSQSHLKVPFLTAQSQTPGGLRGAAGYDFPLGQFIPTHSNGYAADTALNNYGADTNANAPMTGGVGRDDWMEQFSTAFPSNGYDPMSSLLSLGADTNGNTLRGGTQYFFYSKEGQDYLEKLRARRITELNAIEKGDFSGGPPKPVPVSPSTDEVDAVLAKVLDQFESGAFPSSLIDDLNRLQAAFLRIGATITANKVAKYTQIIGRLIVQSDRIAGVGAGPFSLDAQQKKVVRATGLVLDRLQRLLMEINRVVNEPENVRQQVVAEIGSRILGSIAGQQAAYGNPEAGRRRVRGPGQTQADVATRGEVENRQRRVPQPLPEAPAPEEFPTRPF